MCSSSQSGIIQTNENLEPITVYNKIQDKIGNKLHTIFPLEKYIPRKWSVKNSPIPCHNTIGKYAAVVIFKVKKKISQSFIFTLQNVVRNWYF